MKQNCNHPNKQVTDSFNMDGEVYYECPDCEEGWRELPETEEDYLEAEKIEDIDLNALGLRRENI